MYYTIRHYTRFRYSAPVNQSLMELRMQPRSDGHQRCLTFDIALTPTARLHSYRDYLGNTVHHFDIPGPHRALHITAEAQVEMQPFPDLPDSLPRDSWDALAELARTAFDWTLPSPFTQPTPLLNDLVETLGAVRHDDPLTLIRQLSAGIYQTFEYSGDSTRVDSPIDDALRARRGVCQDFSHILLALLRPLGIPCRYVSGYLFHRPNGHGDRSAPDASHAWIEALLPELGWVGFDPTNNVIAAERHIRVAIGRDYADVPPTRGVFKGKADTELGVGVRVALSDAPPIDLPPLTTTWHAAPPDADPIEAGQDQQ